MRWKQQQQDQTRRKSSRRRRFWIELLKQDLKIKTPFPLGKKNVASSFDNDIQVNPRKSWESQDRITKNENQPKDLVLLQDMERKKKRIGFAIST